ncbi:MAG: carboxypeptidase regulatory-like domain-containing protein [Pyrinomonadaceae bacterium]|nr:carboxypeptidase regulatory-like domain-containing protein [Pyrinomonadaceae bacterium]
MRRTKVPALRSTGQIVILCTSAICLLIAVVYFSQITSAANRTWDGGGTSNNWSEAANWSNDTAPVAGDIVTFDSTSSKDATVDVNVALNSYTINPGYSGVITIANGISFSTSASSTQNAGTINVGGGAITLMGNNYFLNGGTFDAGSGTVNVNFFLNVVGGTFDGDGATITIPVVDISGGSFIAPTGTLVVSQNIQKSGGTADLDNGTIYFNGFSNGVVSGFSTAFKNLTIGKGDNVGVSFTGTNIVTGTLTLTDGLLNSGTLEARGPVDVAAAFGQADGAGDGIIAFRNGTEVRTITIPAGVALPDIIVNDPSAYISSPGTGIVRTDSITLQEGSIDFGQKNVIFGYQSATSGSAFTQSGGTFGSTGTITWNTAGSFTLSNGNFIGGQSMDMTNCGIFSIGGGIFTPPSTGIIINSGPNGAFQQSGGVFSGTSGNVDINGSFALSGGEFVASSGTTSFGFGFNHTAGIFSHSVGTIIFDSTHPSYSINAPGNEGTELFNNLTVNLASTNGEFTLSGDYWEVGGTLRIVNGRVNAGGAPGTGRPGAFLPKGDVIVENTADGGNAQVRFGGTANQTFTNNGGPNFTGTWTVDKPSGTVNSNGSLLLTPTTALNITSGSLYLGNNADLTAGPVTIGSNGRFINDSATTITLGGDLSNNGRVDLQGGGAGCPEADTVLIRSSVTGTQRNWSGNGLFRIVDADVRDMAGASAITTYSSTSTGNNGANWTFDTGCPSALAISPAVANKFIGQTQTFTSGGGFAPRTFSIAVNNSGATINPSTGLYTAGSTFNVMDTVRVTDGFGTTADATVNISAGPPTQLAFVVQPSNATAGQSIAHAVQVAIRDASGNTVTNSSDPVTISLANNPGGSTLAGTITRNAVNGTATFNDLSLDRVGVGYTFVAAAPGLTLATSGGFEVTFGSPSALAFTVQPSNTAANAAISPAIQVAVRDAFGNTVTNAVTTIAVAIGHNPAGGTLSGTTTRTAVLGVANFSDLSIDNIGSGYNLDATATGLASSLSGSFDIISPFVVTNTNDGGFGSLRQAIINSNLAPGTQTISFNIPGAAPFTIAPNTELPVIIQPVIIDGTTQPGFSSSPVVEISGANIPAPPSTRGLRLAGGSSTIRGLTINRFGSEIFISTGWGNVIEGNFLGTDVTGSTRLSTASSIKINYSNDNLIGGSSAAQRNVIATGITVSGNGNSIRGNYIGTNAAGTAAIGLNVGIDMVNSSTNTVVGGSLPGEGNLISGNVTGISIYSGSFSITGNRIGTDVSGSLPIPNGRGIRSTYGFGTIGGIAAGENNTIAFNTNAGVALEASASISVRGNVIHSNGGLGIDLGSSGVTPNDPGDADSGANSLQNFPVLALALGGGGSTTVQGTLNSNPSANYTLDFYSSPTCDATGFGEGAVYLGSTSVSTDAANLSSFNAILSSATTIGQFVTATATDSQGKTSEFSQCRLVSPSVVTISGRVADSANQPLPNTKVRLTGSVSALTLTNKNGEYSFADLPAGSNFVVTPSQTNFTFSPVSRNLTNVISNQTNQNFTATKTKFRVAGSISILSNGLSIPLSGAFITLSGTGSGVSTGSSSFAFNNLLPGTYTLTPTKDGIVFLPPSVDVTITASDINGITFQGTAATAIQGRIFFGGPQIGSINADGSAECYPLITGAGYSRPAPTRDGKKLAFIRGLTLRIANADGSGETTVPLPPQSVADPEFSPAGERIAYVTAATPQLRFVNTDGSGQTTIATGSLTFLSSPAWINSGRLVFSAFDGSDEEIYAVNTDGSGLVQLTNNNSIIDMYPSVSPDGTEIAFLSYVGFSSNPRKIIVMNSDGTSPIQIATDAVGRGPVWSPDGTLIAYNKQFPNGSISGVTADPASGTQVSVIGNGPIAQAWAPAYDFATAIGTNVNVNGGGASVTFGGVSNAGTTTFTPIEPLSAGTAPNGFVLGGVAYEISTTAAYTSPVTVCFVVPPTFATTAAAFNQLSLLHNEGGVLTDRTTSRDFATRTICGLVSTLSPFVLGEFVDSALPSITGLVEDENGVPLANVFVQLTGTENRTAVTDQFGIFSFVNLTDGGNYSVQPKEQGRLFNAYSQDFFGISGETSAVFVGTLANFTISGRVSDENGNGIGGVAIELKGASSGIAITDANGDYSFTSLPADGGFIVTPSGNGFASQTIDALTSDIIGLDFTFISPTAAGVSVGGRITTPNGQAIGMVRVMIENQNGARRQALTNPFGHFRFDDLAVGETYIISVSSKRYTFAQPTRLISVNDELVDVDFVSESP